MGRIFIMARIRERKAVMFQNDCHSHTPGKDATDLNKSPNFFVGFCFRLKEKFKLLKVARGHIIAFFDPCGNRLSQGIGLFFERERTYSYRGRHITPMVELSYDRNNVVDRVCAVTHEQIMVTSCSYNF